MRERSRWWVLVAALAPLPLIAALILDSGSVIFLTAVVLAVLLLATAALVWAVGRSRQQRRDYEERLASWAADRAVEKERLRIARDLHDLSSHGLGLITVRAASTGFLAGPDADAERQRAMHDIERISRQTTSELRDMLLLLRSAGEHAAPLRPAETLAALPGIVEDAERSGLTIHSTMADVEDIGRMGAQLSQGAQLAICTVLREALTNVLRHAGPTTVRCALTADTDWVIVVVEDDGRQPGWVAQPGAGHGLMGLRERVEVHGGTLTAAPTVQGFRLQATFPRGEDR